MLEGSLNGGFPATDGSAANRFGQAQTG